MNRILYILVTLSLFLPQAKAVNNNAPYMGEVKALKAEQALVKFGEAEGKLDELANLSKSLEGKNVDEAIEILEGNATATEAIPNLVNTTNNVIDDITSAALQTQDVTDEIVKTNNTLSDAAKKMWQNHEVNVTNYLRETYGSVNVGRQITATVTLKDGSVFEVRFDNLVKEGNLYQIFDAKSSITTDLSKKSVEDLMSNTWSTDNQIKLYNALKNGDVQSITPHGQNAIDYFVRDLDLNEIPSDILTETNSNITFLVNDEIVNGKYNMFNKIYNFK